MSTSDSEAVSPQEAGRDGDEPRPSGRRECAYRECGVGFAPSVERQRFHDPSCRKAEHREKKLDRATERVLEKVRPTIRQVLGEEL